MVLKRIRISIAKFILPIIHIIFKILKSNTRAINYLNEKKTYSNNSYNFQKEITHLLENKKLIGLDVGAQGGFNSDKFFPQKYNKFFQTILVDPLKDSLENVHSDHTIYKGLWSSKELKKLFILSKRPGSSSMFEPNNKSFSIYGFKKKDFDLFKVTETKMVECDTISSCLQELKINKLDFLKIDTQGSEFEILKGLNEYKPLLIKCEVQIFPMYKNQSSWTEITNLLNKLGYIISDWRKIGSHATRTPVEMDMIFIPNFFNELGKNLILKNKNEYICLMLISGQIRLLKESLKILNLESLKFLDNLEDKFFN